MLPKAVEEMIRKWVEEIRSVRPKDDSQVFDRLKRWELE